MIIMYYKNSAFDEKFIFFLSAYRVDELKRARVQSLSIQNPAVGANYRLGICIIQLVATQRIA